MSLFLLFWFLKFDLKGVKSWIVSWAFVLIRSEAAVQQPQRRPWICSIYSCVSRFKNTSTVWWSRRTITHRLMKVSWISLNLSLLAPAGKYHEPRPSRWVFHHLYKTWWELADAPSQLQWPGSEDEPEDGGMDWKLQWCLRHPGQKFRFYHSSDKLLKDDENHPEEPEDFLMTTTTHNRTSRTSSGTRTYSNYHQNFLKWATEPFNDH